MIDHFSTESYKEAVLQTTLNGNKNGIIQCGWLHVVYENTSTFIPKMCSEEEDIDQKTKGRQNGRVIDFDSILRH